MSSIFDELRAFLIATETNQPPIIRQELVTSGVYTEYADKPGYLQSLTGSKEDITREDFVRTLNKVPLDSGYLVFSDVETKETYFIKEDNAKALEIISEKGWDIYTRLDELVKIAYLSGISDIYLEDRVYIKRLENDGKGIVEYEKDLDVFSNQLIKEDIIRTASKQSGLKEDLDSLQGDLEFNTTIQGLEIKIVTWVDGTDGLKVGISILPPIDDIDVRVKRVFQSSNGFIFINRDIARAIPTLLGDRLGTKRIAYVNMKNQLNAQGRSSHFNINDTNLTSLRNRDFDVYVINMDAIKDFNDLLALPSNKLNILVSPIDTHTKALTYLSMFKYEPLVKNHLIDNLIGIVANLDGLLLIDDWSRRLLMNEVKEPNILQLLETPFIIRDNIDLSKGINIDQEIEIMLKEALEVGAANIDICPGSAVRFYKTKTEFEFYSSVMILPVLSEIMILNMMNPHDIDKLYANNEIDFSYSVPGVGRYRVAVTQQRSSYAISIRNIMNTLPSIDELGLPKGFVQDAAQTDKGITMIIGEPNSGKTTTFNCIIDEIARVKGGVIFMAGNPIEFTHRHQKALVIQIEIGQDLPSYGDSIIKSLRMNTSTTAFEELRTKEEYAALGQIMSSPTSIFMTSHKGSAKAGIEDLIMRLVETGVSVEKAREDVANALNFIMSQRLIDKERPDGKVDRILLYEKVKVTPPIRNLIRNGNTQQLDMMITSSPECESLDEVIFNKLEERVLEFEDVEHLIRDVGKFENAGYKFKAKKYR